MHSGSVKGLQPLQNIYGREEHIALFEKSQSDHCLRKGYPSGIGLVVEDLGAVDGMAEHHVVP